MAPTQDLSPDILSCLPWSSHSLHPSAHGLAASDPTLLSLQLYPLELTSPLRPGTKAILSLMPPSKNVFSPVSLLPEHSDAVERTSRSRVKLGLSTLMLLPHWAISSKCKAHLCLMWYHPLHHGTHPGCVHALDVAWCQAEVCLLWPREERGAFLTSNNDLCIKIEYTL